MQINVQVANGEIITSSHVGQLSLPDSFVLNASVFSKIRDSLLSTSQLVDLGFTVVYDTHSLHYVVKDKITHFSGKTDPVSRLWMVNLSLLAKPIAPALPACTVVPDAVASSASPAVCL